MGSRFTDTFTIAFSVPIAAFGFYGIDIGDGGGRLSLSLYDNSNNLIDPLDVNNSILASSDPADGTDGSVLYYGLLAQGSAQEFTKVTFIPTPGAGSTDFFGFDNFTIGTQEQVVPEPATMHCSA